MTERLPTDEEIKQKVINLPVYLANDQVDAVVDLITRTRQATLKEVGELVEDYFSLSWGEFHKKYSHIPKGKLPGDEIK